MKGYNVFFIYVGLLVLCSCSTVSKVEVNLETDKAVLGVRQRWHDTATITVGTQSYYILGDMLIDHHPKTSEYPQFLSVQALSIDEYAGIYRIEELTNDRYRLLKDTKEGWILFTEFDSLLDMTNWIYAVEETVPVRSVEPKLQQETEKQWWEE
jgi:hypothetical protein